MVSSKSNTCLFCKLAFQNTTKIHETKNFIVVSDGAPLGPGHLLLIPKQHFYCYGNLPKKLDKEFSLLKTKIIFFLENNYGRTIMFEHGIFGQTIYHAHLHFLPTAKKVFPYVSKTYPVKKINGFFSLREELKKNKGYLFFKEDGSDYIIDAKNPLPGFFHTYILSKLLGVPGEFDKRAKNAKKIFSQTNKLWKDTVG